MSASFLSNGSVGMALKTLADVSAMAVLAWLFAGRICLELPD
jgi:hypothetical protein